MSKERYYFPVLLIILFLGTNVVQGADSNSCSIRSTPDQDMISAPTEKTTIQTLKFSVPRNQVLLEIAQSVI